MAKSKKVAVPEVVITELELVSIETTKKQLAELRKSVRTAEALLEQQETTVLNKIQQGAAIQGRLSANAVEETGPCRPKWQELFLNHQEAEHGISRAQAEEDARKLYPPKAHTVLVIGIRPAVQL